jgi:hypothetical protein
MMRAALTESASVKSVLNDDKCSSTDPVIDPSSSALFTCGTMKDLNSLELDSKFQVQRVEDKRDESGR